ncbi:MAG: helix-turn-helix transcriptional regulator [Candidatus Omnitrophota bacterium]
MIEDQAPYFATPGDMIRQIRKSKMVTIVELAERMGVSQDYIARLELGEVKPTKEQIEVIQTFLD